jgi:hypothetical protein
LCVAELFELLDEFALLTAELAGDHSNPRSFALMVTAQVRHTHPAQAEQLTGLGSGGIWSSACLKGGDTDVPPSAACENDWQFKDDVVAVAGRFPPAELDVNIQVAVRAPRSPARLRPVPVIMNPYAQEGQLQFA